LTGPLSLSEIC